MSKASTAPNDTKSAKRYVNWLGNSGVCSRILICGSRSPLREKQPHKDSDWDLVVVTDIEKLVLFSPRTGNVLHADLLIVNEKQVKYLKKPTEIWPNDEHGVLK